MVAVTVGVVMLVVLLIGVIFILCLIWAEVAALHKTIQQLKRGGLWRI